MKKIKKMTFVVSDIKYFIANEPAVKKILYLATILQKKDLPDHL